MAMSVGCAIRICEEREESWCLAKCSPFWHLFSPSPPPMLTLCHTPYWLCAPTSHRRLRVAPNRFSAPVYFFPLHRRPTITAMYCNAASAGRPPAAAVPLAVPCSARCRPTAHRPLLSVLLPSGNAPAPAGRIFVTLGRGCWGHVHS
jgi:hypothetical protein